MNIKQIIKWDDESLVVLTEGGGLNRIRISDIQIKPYKN